MYIQSSKLINLGEYTKSLINDGVYYLFKASNIQDVEYLLKTSNSEVLFLGDEGQIISKQTSVNKDRIGDYVHFEDMAVATTHVSLNLNIV
ncbi:MAG: hypothetical protein J7J96_06895 [Sulfurimonas sp.]|nr:hypothetical protein [Sulfurimonas sp.]